MINEIIIKGNHSTTFFDITFSTNGMDLIMSGGSYHINNEMLFSDENGGSITIPTTPNVNYEVHLLKSGVVNVLQYIHLDEVVSFYENNEVIDLLAWFTVGENVTSLDQVQINVKKMVYDNEY